MSRALGAVVVAVLMAISTVAVAGVEETGSYKDAFTTGVSYAGSDGSIHWVTSWQEVGEQNGPVQGKIHVDADPDCYDHKCLHIFGEGETFEYDGALRYADASMFEDADLCYELSGRRDGEPDEDVRIWIKVTDDYGESWDIVHNFRLDDLVDNPKHPSVNVSNWLTEGFGVKFVVGGDLEGEFFVDNVEIKGSVETTSTSSTTSTTEGTTSTTEHETTSTTEPKSTTTTSELPTTTTVERASTTIGPSRSADTTSTTVAETTTTTVAAGLPPGPVDPPSNTGLRTTDNGVQASYSSELFGSMDTGAPEVLGVDFEANYSMAVEVFSATWVWLVALLLIIATAIVTGLERRRPAKGPAAA